MSCQYLSTCGDDVKILNYSNFCEEKSLNVSGPFSNVSWSYDGMQLAAIPAGGNKPVLTWLKNSAFSTVDLSINDNITHGKFMRKSSQYVGFGTKTGSLLIWNLKFQKLKKSYTNSNCKLPVSCIDFNWNDTYAASGYISGDIVIYNILSGQTTAIFKTQEFQPVTCLQYSAVKKSLLGSTSDSGTVLLWDTHSKAQIHKFSSSHLAPSTGLSFSPVNDMLFASVGLDKKIICYDVHMKMPVKTIMVENPLNCIDFFHNGVILGVGTTKGNVHLYDLRHSSIPFKTIDAHKSAVTGLAFQYIPANNENRKSRIKRKEKESQVSGHKNASLPANETKPKFAETENSRSPLSSNIYSRKEDQKSTTSLFNNLPSMNVPDGNGCSDNEARNSFTNIIFSPISEENGIPRRPDFRDPVGDGNLFPEDDRKSTATLYNNSLSINFPNGNGSDNDTQNSFTNIIFSPISEENGIPRRPDLGDPVGDGNLFPEDDVPTNSENDMRNSSSFKLFSSLHNEKGLPKTEISITDTTSPIRRQPIGGRWQSPKIDIGDRPETAGSSEKDSLTRLVIGDGNTSSKSSFTNSLNRNENQQLDDKKHTTVDDDNDIRHENVATSSNEIFSPLQTTKTPEESTEVLCDKVSTGSTNKENGSLSGFKLKMDLNCDNDQVDNSFKDLSIDCIKPLKEMEIEVKTSNTQLDTNDLPSNIPKKDDSFTQLQIEAMQRQIQEVRDDMEDFKDMVHKDYLSLQFSMIKEFQFQLQEIRKSLEYFSINEDLLQQIEELREENKHLRSMY